MQNFSKKLAAMIGIFLLTASMIPFVAFAQTPTTSITGSQRGQLQQDRITSLKNRADTEIDRRNLSLTNITGLINSMKHITSDEKTSFSSEIQTEIGNLTALKTKIDADIDLPTLRADVQSIVKEYRVYLVFIPQLRELSAADRILDIVDQLTTTIIPKLQNRIQQAQSNGENVSSLQITLTDLQNKLADAKTQANNVITDITPLSPSGYPGNRTTLQSGRTMIQTARQDFRSIQQDARSIIQGLRALKISGTPSPSKTPAPTQ